MKTLKIDINSFKITLLLFAEEKLLDKVDWEDKNNLSESLLIQIDSLLRKNELRVADIDQFSVSSDQQDGYTTTRIAQTVADTLNFAKNM